ncbi:MAG: transcription-repair coupling factor [Verrucomicrobia bacterium]|nr:MAG: transcription-repair coupling factor [Verrucomicrobiota bacterium]
MPDARILSSGLIARAAHHPDFTAHLLSGGKDVGPIVLGHITESAQAFACCTVMHAVRASGKNRFWIVCERPRQRERLAMEMALWGINALVLPAGPGEVREEMLGDPEATAEWLCVLEEIARNESIVILCGSEDFNQTAPAPSALLGNREVLQVGDSLELRQFTEMLTGRGYEQVPMVTSRGQCSVRGGILDVFPFHGLKPLRIEFFDQEIESIREFDLDSQASIKRLNLAEIRFGEPANQACISDYRLPNDFTIAIDQACTADVQITEDNGTLEGEEDFTLAHFHSPLGNFDAGDFVLDEARREQFFTQLSDWKKDGWDVLMVFSNQGEQERFTELAGKNLLRDLGIEPMTGELFGGFTVPYLRLAVLASSELFGRYRAPLSHRRSYIEHAQTIRSRKMLDEIDEGDLVVHYEYGIARYRGIESGDEGDELSLEFRNGMLLAVPLDQAHLVGKFIGIGGKPPELTKLGGTSWKNARKAAEKSIMDYAAQLLRVQAERQSERGHAFAADTKWMWEFEQSFHYAETKDQKLAIEATKRDMEAARPMDRLICGDVGFGKTEVAIRAAFKAITGGKQVALLVPTTVLAEQHWRTFRERMSDYPMRVELLNRFRSASEIRSTIEGLADGSVDLVIGTHRLVSPDVHFKNLGLVIIDEEQRFGVAHKESFKQRFTHVDVLTLSATPIPRTLYMAMMGTRDMSTIETPPPNRVPVSTSICAYDERVIRDAIRREIKRGGQVFFLHNRVKTIEMMGRKIRELVPEAKLLIGHGQMAKDDLEVVMHEFVNGHADVLLATTIIETGIDIPNANTILIDRADRFGLADLYQLRGRVGRAGEKAYAILLLPRDMLTQGDARKRIHAIKQYTELGSGFKIAMKDLEIRGAGNMLGTRQSGHVAQIGFELYCQLLRQSVERLKGNGSIRSLQDCTFKADCVVMREAAWLSRQCADQVPAFLSSEWLEDTGLRVAAYRELAELADQASIDALAKTWHDRFGPLPETACNLLLIQKIRAVANRHQIDAVEISGQRLMLQRHGESILLEERRFPRLTSSCPQRKLEECLTMLQRF